MLQQDGVVLSAINYRDYDKIISVFTAKAGVIQLICKGANRVKNGNSALITPLTRAEFVYSVGKSDIFKCNDISLLNQHLHLRQNLAQLNAACDILRAVSASQLPGNPAPLLYDLLLSYFAKMPTMADPRVLAVSFRLKILRHDGLFSEESLSLSDFEIDWCRHLAYCQSFLDLETLRMPDELVGKLDRFFLDIIH